MRQKRFVGELQGGHKEAALEVPFDPAECWGIQTKRLGPKRLWLGRRGYGVKGKINGVAFESVVVPRARRFYLLIPDELQSAMEASLGDAMRVAITPLS